MKKIFLTKHMIEERGITLFIALIITSTLLLVAMGIIALSVREAFLSSSARESQYAFYAADTGAECAIFWDVKNPDPQNPSQAGISAFSTSTNAVITCNRDGSNLGNIFNVGGGGTQRNTSTFTMTFLPEPYCAKVVVTKNADNTTKIESFGYNIGDTSCNSNNPRRVERAVRVTY